MALIKSSFNLAVGVSTAVLVGAASCLTVASDIDAVSATGGPPVREGLAGAFGKALVGAFAQRTASRLIAALL